MRGVHMSNLDAQGYDIIGDIHRCAADMGGKFTTVNGEPYPRLPEHPVPEEHRSYIYTEQVPVFYAHYWRRGTPEHLHDWTDYTACVNFSAVIDGPLTAYRPEHYVSVGA